MGELKENTERGSGAAARHTSRTDSNVSSRRRAQYKCHYVT